METKSDPDLIVKLGLQTVELRPRPSNPADFIRYRLTPDKKHMRACGYDWRRAAMSGHLPLPQQQQQQESGDETRPTGKVYNPEDLPPPPPKRSASQTGANSEHEPRDEEDPRGQRGTREPTYWAALKTLASVVAKEKLRTDKVIRDLRDNLPDAPVELPPFEDAKTACVDLPELPIEIVAGILHEGLKMSINGGSKSFKTWILIDLAACIAAGIPWLDRFETVKSRVLYVNFELPRPFALRRIDDIYHAHGLEAASENLVIWNLRGHANAAEIIIPQIIERASGQDFKVIIIDPIYKILGDRDENSASDITDLMRLFDDLTIQTSAAVVFAGHYAKGNAASKEPIDRMSGSGVLARDPDSIIMMTKHEEDECFSIDFILRNLPQQEKIAVRREHPLMVIDETLDPEKLKQPKRQTGREPEYHEDQLLECLGPGMTTTQWEEKTRKVTKMAESTFKRLKKKLMDSNKVAKSAIDDTWIDMIGGRTAGDDPTKNEPPVNDEDRMFGLVPETKRVPRKVVISRAEDLKPPIKPARAERLIERLIHDGKWHVSKEKGRPDQLSRHPQPTKDDDTEGPKGPKGPK